MQRKYSLPRHTNLAPLSSRFGAFFVDAAIGLALFFLLFYGVAIQIFQANGRNELNTQMQTYDLDSGLTYLKEDGEIAIYDSSTDYTVFVEPVTHYYLHYLTGEVLDGEKVAPNYNEPIKLDNGQEILPKDYYTVAWYNYYVLGITIDDPDSETSALYFTYAKDEAGNYDKSVIGVPREKRYNPDKDKVVDLTSSDITYEYKVIYQNAYFHLHGQDFYSEVALKFNLGTTICTVSSILVSGAVVYLLMPFIFKNGQTIGKKILKLGLANYEGYRFKDAQLLLRFTPFLVTAAAFYLPFWTNLLVIILIPLTVLLASFAFLMASPKRAALHDLAARTIVIDLKSSIIFDNFAEEEEYTLKEDNLPKEPVLAGEEPELKYEK